MGLDRPESAWSRTLPLLIAAIAVCVHAGGLRNGFTFDDPYIVVENPLVSGPGGPWPIFASHYWAGHDPEGDLYRPVTVLSYWLNHRLGGAAPWSYHLVNCLLHGTVTALVYALFRRLTGTTAAAAAGALLFASHPVHTEAVAS